MAQYQKGVIAEASPFALFLTFNQTRTADALSRVKQLLAKVPSHEREFNQSHPDGEIHIVAAIGSHYWSQLQIGPAPSALKPFPNFENGENIAPNTPVDLFFHIRSQGKDLNFLVAQKLREELADAVTLVEEVEGFRYLDSRDLTGFVDGTENPEGDNRVSVAVVGEEDAQFSGGSYIHIQRYEHNMPFWNAQPTKLQEDTVGRTKTDNIEYPSSEKALTAHTKRTSLKDADGNSIEILRHSMPYGDTQTCGLLFASYCRTPENFTLMLQSMIEGDGHGHTDHLLKYTRAVTGHSLFAPSVSFLESLADQ